MAEYVNPIPVGACIVENSGRILLLKRAIEPGIGRWSLPSGHYEPGETAEDGIAREILEETGLAVEVKYLSSNAKVISSGVSYLALTFVAHTDCEPIVLDSENSGFAWVSLSDADLNRYDWAFLNQKQVVLDYMHPTI